MSSWHSYTKSYNLGHAALKKLFDGPVTVEEKIDGSQFSFGVFAGEVKCRSKGREIVPEAVDDMFKLAVQTVIELAPTLKDRYTYRGEYLQKPKHNCLAYDRTPKANIIIFDIQPAEEAYLSYEDKRAEANRIGLEVVPLIYEGPGEDMSVERIQEILKQVSILGGQTIEGVVIKNYTQFGSDKKVVMGKYVSEAFKEVHKKDWGESNPGKSDMLGFLGHKFKTYARWNKAVQHLKEAGNLTDSPKDIGNLMLEVKRDIQEECKDEIVEVLLKWALPHVLRSATAGLPEWYKEQLLAKQFADKPIIQQYEEDPS
jgi:hypothetical protein